MTETEVETKQMLPSWADQEIIDALPEEKQKYWANRMQGNPGQGEKPSLEKMFKESGVSTGFSNSGKTIVYNRISRRNRPATDPKYTKSTHSLKKSRG